MHVAFLAGVGEPHLFSGVGGFEVAVSAAGEFGPVDGQSQFHHFAGEVAAVFEVAFGDGAAVGVGLEDFGADGLAFAEANERPFGLLPVGVIDLGGVDAEEADLGFADDDGIAVDDAGGAGEAGELRRGSGGGGVEGGRFCRSGRARCPGGSGWSGWSGRAVSFGSLVAGWRASPRASVVLLEGDHEKRDDCEKEKKYLHGSMLH